MEIKIISALLAMFNLKEYIMQHQTNAYVKMDFLMMEFMNFVYFAIILGKLNIIINLK